ncbi:pseudaminic acid synthase [Helicobacter pullorum]|uniref:pseudaminic acid synthase n=1 Tax=Helicobacter pullorum TaxID=35818 RepID=UPI0008168DA3|nr:pseudaminic acid synthase [Helicobacter pullorum]OCR03921.1 pseudaminic acid synthase [Helicobacter pullorum]OCR06636.1 pseudaminic acid synthase [Helicobacter pullorum]OCR09442.1 pseudaminic acid synthase [Helicobacter pullorum]OCR11909.1 pseudaminic acid synthase [Helicobacter pullorum]
MQKNRIFLVAELSANHHQSKDIALKTIKAAKESGADAVKLQTYTPECLTLNCNSKYFQIQGTLWEGKNFYQLYQEAMTPWEWHKDLFEYAKELGIICFSSPFSKEGVDFLEELGNPIYKVASFEIVDLELIEYMAKTKKPIILSKGIATKEEIKEALDVCKKEVKDITLLQCTSSYPAPLNEANLSLIPKIQRDFGVKVGLSDHTLGITAPIVAASLGAKVIEKHFILDRKLGGPDSAFSIEPQEFSAMAKALREVEELLGVESYELSQKSKEGRVFMRSLFVVEDIAKGERIKENQIRSIRPGYGIPPKMKYQVVGKKAKKALKRGEPLSFGDWE